MKPSKDLRSLAKAQAEATFSPNQNNTRQAVRLTQTRQAARFVIGSWDFSYMGGGRM